MIRWIVLFILLLMAAALSGLTVAGGATFFLAKGLAFVFVFTIALLVVAGMAVMRGIVRMTR